MNLVDASSLLAVVHGPTDRAASSATLLSVGYIVLLLAAFVGAMLIQSWRDRRRK